MTCENEFNSSLWLFTQMQNECLNEQTWKLKTTEQSSLAERLYSNLVDSMPDADNDLYAHFLNQKRMWCLRWTSVRLTVHDKMPNSHIHIIPKYFFHLNLSLFSYFIFFAIRRTLVFFRFANIHSPYFWSSSTLCSKVNTPLIFTASESLLHIYFLYIIGLANNNRFSRSFCNNQMIVPCASCPFWCRLSSHWVDAFWLFEYMNIIDSKTWYFIFCTVKNRHGRRQVSYIMSPLIEEKLPTSAKCQYGQMCWCHASIGVVSVCNHDRSIWVFNACNSLKQILPNFLRLKMLLCHGNRDLWAGKNA